MSNFVYIDGPTGRSINVDANGRLICNADASTSGFIFGYGEKGYPLVVDGAGRLLVNVSGVASTSGGDVAYLFTDAIKQNFGLGDDIFPVSIGQWNIGIGSEVHSGSGNVNVAIGRQTFRSNKTGAGCIAIGYLALDQAISAFDNIAIGTRALEEHKNGNNNIAIGYKAQEFAASGNGNISLGHLSLADNKVGNDNVGIGTHALHQTTESYNVAIGYQALYYLATGEHNIAVGINAGIELTDGAGNTLLGSGTSVGVNATGRNALGTGAVASGDYTIRLGSPATTVQCEHLFVQKEITAENIVMLDNILIGEEAGTNITTGTANVGIGPYVANVCNGDVNVAIGFETCATLPTGSDENIAIGVETLKNDNNVVVLGNIAIGSTALTVPDEASDYNIAIGYNALPYVGGNDNICIGRNACDLEPQTMDDCIAIGRDTDITIGSSNAIAIGQGASASGSNTMRLGNQTVEVQCENLKIERDFRLGVYTSGTRPSAGIAGRLIFNTDDGKINVDNGTNWTWADGTVI